MSVTLRDVLPAVLDALVANGPLATACTGGSIAPSSLAAEVRIYGEGLPAPPIVSSLTPNALPATIVIAGAPGNMDRELPVQGFARVEMRAYHLDRMQARHLFFVALNALCGDAHYSQARGVWFQINEAPLPVTDNELNSNFPLARAMLPLHIVVS